MMIATARIGVDVTDPLEPGGGDTFWFCVQWRVEGGAIKGVHNRHDRRLARAIYCRQPRNPLIVDKCVLPISHAALDNNRKENVWGLDGSGFLGNLRELLHLSDNVVHFLDTLRELNVKH